jgi:hypothetical protein
MKAYFELWRIIKIKKDYKLLLNFSYYIIRISHDEEVTTDDWIKSYIFYTKALYLNGRIDEAIELLRSLLDIFSNISLDEIKFLSEVHKSNKISTTNHMFNFDHAIKFYSKYHVFKKCEAIFLFNYKSKTNKTKFQFIENGNNITKSNIDYNPVNNNMNESFDYEKIQTELRSSIDESRLNESFNLYDHQTENHKSENEINITTLDQLHEYLDKHIEKIKITDENTCNIIIK